MFTFSFLFRTNFCAHLKKSPHETVVIFSLLVSFFLFLFPVVAAVAVAVVVVPKIGIRWKTTYLTYTRAFSIRDRRFTRRLVATDWKVSDFRWRCNSKRRQKVNVVVVVDRNVVSYDARSRIYFLSRFQRERNCSTQWYRCPFYVANASLASIYKSNKDSLQLIQFWRHFF